MATGTSNELAQFHEFLSEKLTGGAEQLSPEEALDLWRAEHPGSNEYESAVAALKEALGEMDRGDRGVPLDEFDCDFRKRHHLAPEV